MTGNPDLNAAREFLNLLDPTTKDFCFRTFDDRGRSDPKLVGKFGGTLESSFSSLTDKSIMGAGVFVVVNQGGQNAASITRIRHVFVDTDGAPLDPIVSALPPHMIVESSPNRYHVYWRVDGVAVSEFKGIQKAAIAKFGTDPVVHDLPRVMRLPGFNHQKGTPFRTRLVHSAPNLGAYALDQLKAAFGTVNAPNAPTLPPGLNAAAINANLLPQRKNSAASSFSLAEAEAMLRYLEPFQHRDLWLDVAFALADAFGEGARDLYERWSRGDLWAGAK